MLGHLSLGLGLRPPQFYFEGILVAIPMVLGDWHHFLRSYLVCFSYFLSIALGGMVSPDSNTPSGLETFFDLVVSYTISDLTLLLNADYNINRADDDPNLVGFRQANSLQGVEYNVH